MVSLYELNILLDLAGILFCAVCMLVVAAWRRLLCASARHLLSILGANTLVLLSNCVGLLYKGQPGARIHLLLCASNFLEFAGGYLLSMAATYYIFSCVERSGPPLTALRRFCRPYFAAILALLVISQFTGLYYTIGADNVYQRGALFPLSIVVSVGTMAMDLAVTWKNRRRLHRREFISFMLYVLLPACALVVDALFYGLYTFRASTTLAIVLMFLLMLVTQVERHMDNERQLADMKVLLTISQIQPHFLYNALAAIQYLCRSDPAAASEAVEDFSCYLRGNLSALTTNHPIPFAVEMRHVTHYLALEQRRFGERLCVRTELAETGFSLPPLTVQPLVENAVRYGTGRQLSGVHLTIASWAEEDGYCVRVSDDGPGFDPERYHEDGAPHLGIDSVRSRLASMCGGSLTIASHPGGGTQALIRIPCAPQPRQEGRSAR